MKRVHVVGRKNSGKTTLIVELTEYLTQRGLRVGTIKHTHHRHELDTPGKDSHRHRVAGANTVAVMSPELVAVYRRSDVVGDERYLALEAAFADCDLVLVEGDLAAKAPKVEVWHHAVQEAPYANTVDGIAAVITDDQFEGSSPVWPRNPIAQLAELILLLNHA
ncbi:MAG: molybdopterin-guanine dinucleotide biosynthesis protein B [Pirellulales bacterium]|nr:molybdopterin-guanine dinucleotide biosynthesis protein B [Pirellulales bacterium]